MRLAADENFNNDILRGLRLRLPDVDIIRIQDTDIAGTEDPKVLEWTAKEQRILLTHDIKTMTKYGYERVRQGLSMPGVIEIKASLDVGLAIEELVIFIECSFEGEWEGKIVFLPI